MIPITIFTSLGLAVFFFVIRKRLSKGKFLVGLASMLVGLFVGISLSWVIGRYYLPTQIVTGSSWHCWSTIYIQRANGGSILNDPHSFPTDPFIENAFPLDGYVAFRQGQPEAYIISKNYVNRNLLLWTTPYFVTTTFQPQEFSDPVLWQIIPELCY